MTNKMPSRFCLTCPPLNPSQTMSCRVFCEGCQEEQAQNIVERLNIETNNMHDNSQQQSSEVVAILEKALKLAKDKAKAEEEAITKMWACEHCTVLNEETNVICECCAKTKEVNDKDDAGVALDDGYVDSELAAAIHESKISYQEEEQQNEKEREENKKNGPARNAASNKSQVPKLGSSTKSLWDELDEDLKIKIIEHRDEALAIDDLKCDIDNLFGRYCNLYIPQNYAFNLLTLVNQYPNLGYQLISSLYEDRFKMWQIAHKTDIYCKCGKTSLNPWTCDSCKKTRISPDLFEKSKIR